MIEWLAPGVIYSLAKDGFGAFRRRRRYLTPTQILELRLKWRPLFEDEIWRNFKDKLSQDVIIIDVKRLEHYPNVDRKRKKGISPWFRASVIDTYHKGILVGLNWWELAQDAADGTWHSVRHRSGEKGDANTVLAGKIPYEKIESVEWQGDEYYGYPHIYCHFDSEENTPYESVSYFLEHSRSGRPSRYAELVSRDAVRKNNKRLNIDWRS